MTSGIKGFVPRQTQPGDLARTLRQARKERGLTQPKLAEAAGVDQTTISKIERGTRKDPSLSTIVALERALNVSLGVITIHSSLARFLLSDLGRRLQIGAAEERELAALQWWEDGSDPTDDDWYELVKLRRSTAARTRRP